MMTDLEVTSQRGPEPFGRRADDDLVDRECLVAACYCQIAEVTVF